ncbi:DNA helicase [Mycobacterium phage Morty007]|nr:DNA helicase [Mycobacterium phage Morty007]
MTSTEVGNAPGEPRELRPYQREAADRVEADWAAGHLRAGVVLPTGAGKSTVGGEIVARAYRRGERCVFIAHRDLLISQLIRDTKAVDPSIPDSAFGIVQGEKDDHHAPIVAATLQTLQNDRRVRSLGFRDVIVWDEVHHAGAPTWTDAFRAMGGFDGSKVMGLTATMFRQGNAKVGYGLGDIIQKISYERDLRWAIDNGFLVQPRGLTVKIENLDKLNDIRNVAGDFKQSELAEVMEAAVEYVVDAIDLHCTGRRPIVFAASVEGAYAITDAINARGNMTAEFVVGADNAAKRDATFDRFRSGETQVLVTVMVLTEGADFPMCDTVVMARPTRSKNLYSQMVGRALRLYPGKDDALVVDLSGSARQMKLVNLSQLDPGAETKAVDVDGMEILDDSPVDDYVNEDEKPIKVTRQGVVELVSIDLLRGSETIWLETPKGVPFVSGNAKRIVFLWPEDGRRNADRWAVGIIHQQTRKGGFMGGGDPQYVEIGEAMDAAEAWINEHPEEFSFSGNKNASWRKYQAPSDKQLNLARMLGIPGYADMTKARLSDEISVAFAARVLDGGIVEAAQ